MCGRPDCVYCEIIELPSYSKLFIHYNSLFTPLWIEYYDDATSINEKYFPQRKINLGKFVKLDKTTIDLDIEDINEEKTIFSRN